VARASTLQAQSGGVGGAGSMRRGNEAQSQLQAKCAAEHTYTSLCQSSCVSPQLIAAGVGIYEAPHVQDGLLWGVPASLTTD
jgi:hypothetical protein